MVRDAIARHGDHHRAPESISVSFTEHSSHALLPLIKGGDPDGQCLIEPAVRCNHCGYCQSMGH